MKPSCLLFSLFILGSPLFSQSPSIEWQNTIGGYNDDNLTCIRQTDDGGFILGGDSYSGANGDKTETKFGDSDYWIVKLDSTGNVLWQNTIGGSSIEVLNAMEQTLDGGYIIVGCSLSPISGDTLGREVYPDKTQRSEVFVGKSQRDHERKKPLSIGVVFSFILFTSCTGIPTKRSGAEFSSGSPSGITERKCNYNLEKINNNKLIN